jgi:PAS domain S-box-containing protein
MDVDEQIQRSLETGTPWTGTIDMVNADGQSLAVWKRVDVVSDAAGSVAYGVAWMHDITARVENERKVASSRDRYRKVIDSQQEYVCRLNRDFAVTFANLAYAQFWGKTPRAMIGLPYLTIIQGPLSHSLLNSLMVVRSGSTPIEIDYAIKDSHDRTRWQQWRFHGILDNHGKVSEIQCVGRDVTRKKTLENEIQENEAKYRNLAEITSDWIWEVDIDGVYTYASPVVHALLGYRPEEVLGKRPFDFMPEEEARRVERIFRRALVDGSALKNIENINIHKDGSTVILETNGVPVFDHRGMVIGYRGIDRNISSRKRAENRLLEESNKLKLALTRVKRLSGMLPICASCKKIRDDNGYWNQIEAFIANHSEAEFSHGICPACARKLYPELYPEAQE